jgi:hypothetical protein
MNLLSSGEDAEGRKTRRVSEGNAVRLSSQDTVELYQNRQFLQKTELSRLSFSVNSGGLRPAVVLKFVGF